MRENITSLVLKSGMPYNIYAFPRVLHQCRWPELRYIEIWTNYILPHDILALQKTVPKLTNLKLFVPSKDIPDVVWTIDWDSLHWRTGFCVFNNRNNGKRICE